MGVERPQASYEPLFPVTGGPRTGGGMRISPIPSALFSFSLPSVTGRREESRIPWSSIPAVWLSDPRYGSLLSWLQERGIIQPPIQPPTVPTPPPPVSEKPGTEPKGPGEEPEAGTPPPSAERPPSYDMPTDIETWLDVPTPPTRPDEEEEEQETSTYFF